MTALKLGPFPIGAVVENEAAQAFDIVVRYALESQASDLFLLTDEHDVKIVVRRLGIIQPLGAVPKEEGRALLNYVKAAAGIDIGERRRPTEGRLLYDAHKRRVDLRLNFVPTMFGEDMSARLLDREFGLRTVDQLGLARQEHAALMNILNSPSGLVLVTGPTGTGKTTTLYACLQYLNNGARKINTIEDPIEYSVAGVRQSQANARIGVDFPELLRSILRQSPDVIMIGEIRDEETANTAVRAANSGHLVLATLHAPVAAGAVASMLAMGANRFFLATGLLGVIAQRLVRVLCSACRVAYDMSSSPATFEEIRSLLPDGAGQHIYGPGACAECMQQGYTTRCGVFEIMAFNHVMRNMIAHGCSSEELQAKAVENGMLDFRRAALVKVAEGITSTEEVLSEVPATFLGLD
jgi:type II secretory ATPase GspE/PulE/Tfp pilus assembly ATPase PilB-like protein